MRSYTRTSWYGIAYFLRFRGTILPRILPPLLLSSTISILLTNSYEPFDWCYETDDAGKTQVTLMYHPFVLGTVVTIVSFITGARFNISYSRFWDGATQIKIMHSKWTDALIQILAFDRVDDSSGQLIGEPFCEHIVRLFQQLSALATMYLQGENLSFREPPAAPAEPTPAPSKQAISRGDRTQTSFKSFAKCFNISSNSAQCSDPSQKPSVDSMLQQWGRKLGRVSSSSEMPVPWTAPITSTLPKATLERRLSNSSDPDSSGHGLRRRFAEAGHAIAEATHVMQRMGAKKLLVKASEVRTARLHDCFSEEEVDFLSQLPDKMHTQMSRICRSITTRHNAGGIRAPPPLVSRVFQEMSNGAQAFNAATRAVEIPVPFIVVHLHAILLGLMCFYAPVVISCYAGHVGISIYASGFLVGGFCGLWLVANELEDPFGNDDNDMPLLVYHDHFVASIESSLASPWLPKDQWTSFTGNWSEPPSNPAAEFRSHTNHPASHSIVVRIAKDALARRLSQQMNATEPFGKPASNTQRVTVKRSCKQDPGNKRVDGSKHGRECQQKRSGSITNPTCEGGRFQPA